MLWHVLWHAALCLLWSLSKIRSHKGVFVLTPYLHNFPFIAILAFNWSSSSSSDIETFVKYFKTLIDTMLDFTSSTRCWFCFHRNFLFSKTDHVLNRKMPLYDWNDIKNLHKSVLTGVHILNFEDLCHEHAKVIHIRLVVIWNREYLCSNHFDQWL